MSRELELINLELDGAATADEIRELNELAGRSPEVSETWDSYRGVSAQLAAARDLDVPPDLRDAILHAIASRQAARPQLRLVPSISAPVRRKIFAAGSALAAAVAIAIFGPLMYRENASLSPADLSGTMRRTGRTIPPAVNRTSADGALSARLRMDGPTVVLDISRTTSGAVSVRWDRNAPITADPDLAWRSDGPGRISAVCPAGPCPPLLLTVEPGAAPVFVVETLEGSSIDVTPHPE